MNTERLDPKAVKRIGGPSWDALRPAFSRLNDSLLNVSESATGQLTTIYIKYSSPATSGNPFAVVWVKKSSEIVVGLSLPDDVAHDRLGGPPKGCTYAGLTGFVIIHAENEVPSDFGEWAKAAYARRSEG